MDNNIAITIAADISSVNQSLASLEQSMSGLEANAESSGEGIGGSFSSMGAAVAAGTLVAEVALAALSAAVDAVAAVFEGFKEAVKIGGQLSDTAARTGELAGELAVLGRALENTGSSADSTGQIINKMQNFLDSAKEEGSAAAGVLQTLGVSLQTLGQQTPVQQLETLGLAIANVDDPTQRAALAMDILGKSGGKLLPLFTNMSQEMETARGQLGSFPEVMNRSAAAFDKFGDSMNAIGNKVMEFAAGFMESALPALNAFASALADVDAAGWGQKIMDKIKEIAQAFVGAFLSPMDAIDLVFSSIDAYIKGLGNTYANAFVTGTRAITEFFQSDLPQLISDQLVNSLGRAWAQGWADFLTAADKALQALQQGLGEALQNPIKFFSSAFNTVIDALASDLGQALINPIGFIAGKLSSSLKEAVADGATDFSTGFSNSNDTVIGKMASGFQETADGFASKMTEGGEKINNELSKVWSNLEPSATDFFGAVPALEEVKEKAGKLAEKGKEFTDALMPATEAMVESSEKFAQNFSLASAEMDEMSQAVADMERSSEGIAGNFENVVGPTSTLANNLANANAEATALDGKQIKIEVTYTDAELDELRQKLDAFPDQKDIDVALSVTGTDSLMEAREVLNTIKPEYITKLMAETDTTSVEELKALLEGIPLTKVVDVAANLTGNAPEDLSKIRRDIEAVQGTHEFKMALVELGMTTEQFKQNLNGIPDTKTIKLALDAYEGTRSLDQILQGLDVLQDRVSSPFVIKVNTDDDDLNATIGRIDELDGKTITLDINTGFDPLTITTPLEEPITLDLQTDQAKTAVDMLGNAISGLGETGVQMELDIADAHEKVMQIKTNIEEIGSTVPKLSLDSEEATSLVSSLSSDVQSLGDSVSLTLDGEGASAVVDTVKEGVNALGESVPLAVDGEAANATIADVKGSVDALGETVGLNVDGESASSTVSDVAASVEALGNSVPLAVDSTEASSVVSDLAGEVTSLGESVSLTLDPSSASATVDDVASGVDSLGESKTLSVDGAEAKGSVDEVAESANSIGEAKIISVDVESAKSAIEDLVSALAGLEEPKVVSVDTTDAKAAIDALGAEAVTVTIDASASIQEIKDELQNLTGTAKITCECDCTCSCGGGSGGGCNFSEIVTELVQIKERLPLQAMV